MEHFGSQMLLEHVWGRYVDRKIDDLVGFTAEAGEVDEGSAGSKIDKEVNVALWSCFTAGHRAEDP